MAWLMLAELEVKLGPPSRARIALRALRRSNRRDFARRSHLLEAKLEQRHGHPHAALDCLRTFGEGGAETAEALSLEAEILASLGRPADALATAGRALHIDPGDVRARALVDRLNSREE